MVVCPLLLDELAQVLARPKFKRWAAHDHGAAYVAAFAARSAHHPDPTIQTAIVRDPKDDYLVALARAANADVLVSIDNDLLEAPVDDVPICRLRDPLGSARRGLGHERLARGLNPRETARNHRHPAEPLPDAAPANQRLPRTRPRCLKIVVSPARVRVSPSRNPCKTGHFRAAQRRARKGRKGQMPLLQVSS